MGRVNRFFKKFFGGQRFPYKTDIDTPLYGGVFLSMYRPVKTFFGVNVGVELSIEFCPKTRIYRGGRTARIPTF